MTLAEAIDLAVSRSGVERLRWLCSDDNADAPARESYRRKVLELAGAPPPEPAPPPVPLAESLRGVRLGLRNCFYSTHEGCGCSGAMCHHLGRIVNLPDCLACLGKPPG